MTIEYIIVSNPTELFYSLILILSSINLERYFTYDLEIDIMFLDVKIIMGYKFSSNLGIEYPFFIHMAQKLGGRKRKDDFNGREVWDYCRCPTCGKKEAGMYLSRRADTYLLRCPRDKCPLKSLTLHQLIKRCGSPEMFREWRNARWKTIYTEDWLPIKNKRSHQDE